MPDGHRKRVVPRRRRRQDDGEEEGSVIAEFEDDSVSESSILSDGEEDADGEASDISLEDDDPEHPPAAPSQAKSLNTVASVATGQNGNHKPGTLNGAFSHSADTLAMMNGLKPTATGNQEEVHFDDTMAPQTPQHAPTESASAPARQETAIDRPKRAHQEPLKRRSSNPASVPTRGGFFLHDLDRSSASRDQHTRPPGRTRGKSPLNGGAYSR